MGLLDEAIREHLELKKRRGADTGEVARQEKEAFGPPTREVETPQATAAPSAVEDPPALDEPGTFAAEPPEAPTRLHVADAPLDPGAPAAEEGHHLHDHELETEPPRPHGDPADRFPHAAPAEPEMAPPEPELPPEPAVEIPPAAERPAPPQDIPEAGASQPTREFDLDEVRAASGAEPEIVPADEEPEGEGEDMLEETPEFLQETPEHDRLWFEQKPPRDFDF